MKVLLVEDQRTVRLCMKKIIDTLGYEVEMAANGLEGLEVYERFHPDLVITDICMPEMDGVTMLEKIRQKSAEVIVITVTGMGSEDLAVNAFRRGANNYLNKPVKREDLLALLRKYEQILYERSTTREIQALMQEHYIKLQLENRLKQSSQVATFLAEQLGPLLPDTERLDIILGLDELICNAIEHGNLEITNEEKQAALAEPEGLVRLYRQRLENPRLAARRVTVEFRQDQQHGCAWTIADEGQGFDWRDVPSPLEKKQRLKKNGRGIFLSRMMFDAVEYQGKGNVVCARRDLSKTKPPPGEIPDEH